MVLAANELNPTVTRLGRRQIAAGFRPGSAEGKYAAVYAAHRALRAAQSDEPFEGESVCPPFSLALTRPGTLQFDRMFRLIDKPSPAVRMPPAGAKRSQWGYPSAVEHNGKLYIVYSVTKEVTGLTVVDLAKTR